MNELVTQVDTVTLAKMEAVAAQCQLQALDKSGNFERMFAMAAGIRQLEALITPGMMQDVVALQNRPIGFRTDKPGGYPVDTLKSCIIEAVLRGLRTVGNEFNIIADRLYITKEGMSRLVSEYPGLTNLKMDFGVPKTSTNGALVEAKATWSLDSVSQELQRTIPIRVNKGMGCDAILGKATRKLLASVYGRLTGSEHGIPEGDVLDVHHESPADTDAAELGAKLAGKTPVKPPEPATEPPPDDEDIRISEFYELIDNAETITAVDMHLDTAAADSVLTPGANQKVVRRANARKEAIRAKRGQASNT